MVAIIVLIVLGLIVQVLLLALAAATGFCLCWCLPDVGLGTGILTGLIAGVAAIFFTAQIIKIGSIRMLEDSLNDQQEDDEDDILPKVHFTLAPASKNRRQRPKK